MHFYNEAKTVPDAVTLNNGAAVRTDKRQYKRVKVDLSGRFMTPDKREYACKVFDLSPGGAGISSNVPTMIGDQIVAYFDHIGRIEGTVVRHLTGGFGIEINATNRKREKIADQLTYLEKKDQLGLPEDRRHARHDVEETTFSEIILTDGRRYKCRVLDISLSGAAVQIDVKPGIGTALTLGKMQGNVVRHFDNGIAIEFSALQTEASLIKYLNGGENELI